MNCVNRIVSTTLGVVFVASGWLKAVDPFGGALKMEEYLALFDLHATNLGMALAIALAVAEMMVGLAVLLGVYRRGVAIVALGMICVFTALTAYLAFDPYVSISECGCFGDAIELTNKETFAKNVVILLLGAIYTTIVFKQGREFEPKRSLALVLSIFVISISTPLYSLYSLPVFDFLDYNIGQRFVGNNKLQLYDNELREVADSVVANGPNTKLLIVTHRVFNDEEVEKVANIAATNDNRYDIVVLSSCEQSRIADLESYYIDAVAAKEVIRARSGVVLLNDNIIEAKWRLKRFDINKVGSQENLKLIYCMLMTLGMCCIAVLNRYKNR